MTHEASTRGAVLAQLRAAGFEVFESLPDPSSTVHPDVVAWAADAKGVLIPWAVVEIKTGRLNVPELALPTLARMRDVLGTTDHYLLMNGLWFKADQSVRSLERVDGPIAPRYGPRGRISSVELATTLLLKSWRRQVDQEPSHTSTVNYFWAPSDLNIEVNLPGIETASGVVPVRQDVHWKSLRRALTAFASGTDKGGSLASNSAIAGAMAELAGRGISGTVLDPFCGTGSFLWALMDRAVELDEPVEFVGVEVNDRMASLAGGVGRMAPLPTTIVKGDAFKIEMPMANCVLAAPPLGVRLSEPHALLDGSSTTDSAIGAIDLGIRHLRPRGRAVFHVAAGFTFHHVAEEYRKFLAREYRVAAVVGLPGGAMPGTSARSVLLVIERGTPGLTFVAQLGQDWQTQLLPGGAALTAALAHIDADQIR